MRIKMRGNWNPPEPVAITSGQHQQFEHQHQTMAQEQQQPLLSAATPVWGLLQSVVPMNGSAEAKDESGASPDNCTSVSSSPRSRRSSDTANYLSPENCQDSMSQMQYANCDYSAKAIFKTLSAEKYAEMSREMTESELRDTLTEMEMNEGTCEIDMEVEVQEQEEVPMLEVSSTVKSSSKKVSRKMLQCPLCSYTKEDKTEFLGHLKTHCMSCQSNDASPNPEDANEEENTEDEKVIGLKYPHINAQGKVKVYKCKRCSIITLTKHDMWMHQRIHYKPDKVMFCKKCPFSTEYKHHLEYHMRNHYRSKPFECSHCTYTCVNKSMLNSHLKSHSSIYQYRCLTCGYATKYCHSLKLHLRKYHHQPATVLNPDGTPSSSPMIDVYGTKRGPRQKSAKKQTSSKSSSKKANSPTSNDQAVASTSNQTTEFDSNVLESNSQASSTNVETSNYQIPFGSFSQTAPINDQHFVNAEAMYARNMNIAAFMANSYLPPLFNQQQAAMPPPNTVFMMDQITQQQYEMFQNNEQFVEYMKHLHEQQIINMAQRFGPNSLAHINLLSNNTMGTEQVDKSFDNTVVQQNNTISIKASSLEHNEQETTITPLDLSKPESSPSSTESKSSKPKRRRKGKAMKLVLQADSDSDDGKPNDESVVTATPEIKTESSTESRLSKNIKNFIKDNGCFICELCDMYFGNEVMYMVHMGYHGRTNPFTCNMCGLECEDHVSFFVHIARVKH